MIALGRPRGLISAYDRASAGWHGRLSALGFVAAYQTLSQAGVGRAGAACNILDVGCGTGALSEAWLNAGGLATGGQLDLLDPSREMLARAGAQLQHASPRLIDGGVGQAGIGTSYDVVLCAHVLEHLADPVESLAWLAGRLRSGGLLVMAVSQPHWCTALVRLRWGSAAWRPDAVRMMLASAGFGAVTMHPFNAGPPSRLSCGYLVETAG